MDDKKAREAFRVQQHAAPHPALLQQQQRSPLPTTTISLQPDHQRVIIHSDCDCWYAQVEEQRNPALRGLPLAVTQKYLCVTANYAARAAGVTKLMGIKEAKKACPNLVLVRCCCVFAERVMEWHMCADAVCMAAAWGRVALGVEAAETQFLSGMCLAVLDMLLRRPTTLCCDVPCYAVRYAMLCCVVSCSQVPGEDLSPYRAASREVLAVLSRCAWSHNSLGVL